MACIGSTYFATGLIFLLLCRPGQSLSQQVQDGDQGDTEGSGDGLAHVKITEKYILVWDRMIISPRSCFNGVNVDIERVRCTSNNTCAAALCDLDIALSYPSHLPSSPYCTQPVANDNGTTSESGHCTCGPHKCVSYSRDSSHNGRPFFYCGPCGWVGSECINNSCTHRLAECRAGFCECVSDGIFYDMSYCYIPFYGKEMAIEMFIVTSIIVVFCAVLAYGYHRLNRRRQRGFPESWFRGSVTRESPPDDTPPTYDEVVEKLPSYQDALDMVSKDDNGDGGLANPAFKTYPAFPPPYSESENLNTTTTTTTTRASAEPTPSNLTSDLDQNDDPEGVPILGASGGGVSQAPATSEPEKESGGPRSRPVDQSASTGSDLQPIDLPIQEALQDLQTTEASK